MSKEIRPKRTSVNEMPCLQNPRLQCISGCQAFSDGVRKKIMDEVNQDLPPWTDVFSYKVRGKFEDAQRNQAEAERIYNEREQELREQYCSIAFALGQIGSFKKLE